MKYRNGLDRIGTTPLQQGISHTDDVVSVLFRERGAKDPYIVRGEFKGKYDNGHFQEREHMATRFHPINNNKECVGCNRHDYSGYWKDKSFEYGLGIEKKYGPGAAFFLYKLSRQYNQWTANQLSQLWTAARMGPRAYEQLYYELRPEHRFSRKI
jgi:hypothetical protein